jgi:signal transduction histidine kinase
VRVVAANATDLASAPTVGRGLTGIRHRAELLGGDFSAGVHDGRFVVRVVLPL